MAISQFSRKKYQAAYYLANKSKLTARNRAYKRAHSLEQADLCKAWVVAHPERDRAHKAAYRERNREKLRTAYRLWHRLHPEARAASDALRHATKLRATPTWLTSQQLIEIKEIYKRARILQEYDGIKRHVDHIYPLRGKTCCGLHVPRNLQILTRAENLKKSNKLSTTRS